MQNSPVESSGPSVFLGRLCISNSFSLAKCKTVQMSCFLLGQFRYVLSYKEFTSIHKWPLIIFLASFSSSQWCLLCNSWYWSCVLHPFMSRSRDYWWHHIFPRTKFWLSEFSLWFLHSLIHWFLLFISSCFLPCL